MLSVGQFATTFEADHIFFKTEETCLEAKVKIAVELASANVTYIASCHKL